MKSLILATIATLFVASPAFAGPVTAHIFHRDRAAWLDGADHAPTYDERP